MVGVIDPDQRVRLRRGAVVWHEVDGEVLGLALAAGEYVAANRSATALWRMLERGASPRELGDALARTWGLDALRALADAERFVAEVDRQELLELAA
jgi:hypothetical protein